MKRKTAILGVLAFLCLVLAACGLGEEAEKQTQNNETKKGGSAEYGTKQQALTSWYKASWHEWVWDWQGPHLALHFVIRRGWRVTTRWSSRPTQNYTGGLWNWTFECPYRTVGSISNGDDYCKLLVPKTFLGVECWGSTSCVKNSIYIGGVR